MRKTYTVPTVDIFGIVPEEIITGSPLTGITEALVFDSSFETPSEDNDGIDVPW